MVTIFLVDQIESKLILLPIIKSWFIVKVQVFTARATSDALESACTRTAEVVAKAQLDVSTLTGGM